MLELDSAQRRELRARAHTLHPVVSIADNGLSASVIKEIEHSLKAHELIKIRIHGDDREKRAALYAEVCEQLGCAPVQHIGKLLVVYRPRPEPEVSETKAKPTKRRAADAGTAKKKTPSRKLGARTAGILGRAIIKAKRAEAASPSHDSARPRTASGTPGTRRTNGTTVKPATRGSARPAITPAPRRNSKR